MQNTSFIYNPYSYLFVLDLLAFHNREMDYSHGLFGDVKGGEMSSPHGFCFSLITIDGILGFFAPFDSTKYIV